MSDRKRITGLVIPPAWLDVWISVEPLGHIQSLVEMPRGASNARYRSFYGSRGLTTLLRGDPMVEASTITLSFPAKSGKTGVA